VALFTKASSGTVLVGLRGLVGQLFHEDNARKVRGCLAGRIGQGLNAGGKAYGYAPAVGEWASGSLPKLKLKSFSVFSRSTLKDTS
jgi:hypothetical protein